MSVFLAEDCSGPEYALEGHGGYALVAITAKLARDLGMIVARDPSEGPAHVVVVGKKKSSVKKTFAKNCIWVVAPDPPIEAK